MRNTPLFLAGPGLGPGPGPTAPCFPHAFVQRSSGLRRALARTFADALAGPSASPLRALYGALCDACTFLLPPRWFTPLTLTHTLILTLALILTLTLTLTLTLGTNLPSAESSRSASPQPQPAYSP